MCQTTPLVQVRVWLGGHHYILSRYLISRMLTMTRIPTSKVRKHENLGF